MEGLNFFNGPGNVFQGMGVQPSGGGRPFGGFDSKLRPGTPSDPYQQWAQGHSLSNEPVFGGRATKLTDGQILSDILKSFMWSIQDPGFLSSLQELLAFIGGGK